MKINQVQLFKKSVFLLLLLVAIGCKKEPEQWKEKCIIYKDSLYKIPLDTILLFEKDSNYVKKDGYYRVFSVYNTGNYSAGKVKNHKKIGSWKSYFGEALRSEENYNDKGELDGYVINYDQSNGDFVSVFHFVNGEQEGIQKEYHSNNILARVYTLHKSYNYRDEYVCYDEKGKIIYKEDFGREGTGYYKEFKNDTIIKEGTILKDKYVGMYINREYLYDGSVAIEQTFYNKNGGMYKAKKSGNLDFYKSKGDSIVYYYLNNKTRITTFLKGKIIKNEIYNDTLL